METVLTFLYGACVLVFGTALTASFADIRFTKRNLLIFFGLAVCSGCLQVLAMLTASDETVWKLYPLIAHLPLLTILCIVFRKPLETALAAIFTAYLCCQPSKWCYLLAVRLTDSVTVGLAVRILCLIPVGYWVLFHLSSYLAKIFNKDTRSVCIFGIVPAVYYVFDYVTSIYAGLWISDKQILFEFLSFFMAVMYVGFCFLYYKEYEQKADALRKEQIIRTTVEQQAKEIKAVKQIEREIRILRHDMRMFLSTVAVSLENGETEKARELIDSQITRIDGVRLKRFCSNEIVNYVISDYAARCREEEVAFICSVELDELPVDEIMFASILSNAMDNALNAQKSLPRDVRCVKLMLKKSDGKLLLSVKNPVAQPVIFSDGIPVSGKNGHGYGTQSIRYLTERLGGNCQFSLQDDTFILRVVL